MKKEKTKSTKTTKTIKTQRTTEYTQEDFKNDLWEQLNKYATTIGGTVVSRENGHYGIVIGLNDKVNIQFYY